MNKLHEIVIGVLLISVSLQAQDGGETATEKRTFSLKEAQEYALENNTKMKNARLDVEIAKNKVWETTALGLPRIGAEGSVQHFIDIPVQRAPGNAFGPNPTGPEYMTFQFGLANSASAGLVARQLIFDGSYIVGLQAAKTYKLLSEQGLEKSEVEIKELVTQIYYSVLLAQRNREILDGVVKESEVFVNEMKQRYSQGLVDDLALEQLELDLTTKSNSRDQASKGLDDTRKLLNIMLGFPLNSQLELTDKLEEIILGISVDTVANKVLDLNNHVDFKLMNAQVELTRLDMKREKFSRLPSIGAFLNHTQNFYGNQLELDVWYPTTVVGVSLRVPIFDSFGTSAKIKQLKLKYEQTQNLRDDAAKNLELQVSISRATLRSAYDNYKAASKNLELAEKIKNKTIIKYKNGVAGSIDMITVNNQYLGTEGNYISSIFQLLKAKSDLDKALDNRE